MENTAIEYRQGNLLDVKEGIIVHGCNMQGVMGSGVALAVKKKYPECFDIYKLSLYECRLGDCIWYGHNESLIIVNALTQEDFGAHKRQVSYGAIRRAFSSIFEHSKILGGIFMTVNFPKIGAGLGGGDWSIIENIIKDCDPLNQIKKICWTL